ncbi:MAG: tRNA-guanine transglycosylase, partial [Treponema sp.]|nr:tRNA-guanine transglycosylase [Treponema sp.]
MQGESVFVATDFDSRTGARLGVLSLPRGPVSTPAFMPVGTAGAMKALSVDDMREIGFEIILSNSYHLYLRPGMEIMAGAGGLHKFMDWDRNILTDSGGFQVFSLSGLRKLEDDGARFRSHIDGSLHFFTPESVVEIQRVIGSDIQMQLDVCSAWGASRKEAERALALTTGWLARAAAAWRGAREGGYSGHLFSIVQGNFFPDLRRQSAEACIASGTPGVAIGGLSVGEPREAFVETLALTAALLPADKPRYLMG